MSITLIADSGSTKTDWVALKGGDIVCSIQTIGLNPYFTSEEVYDKTVQEIREEMNGLEEVSDVYFYGAGCSSKEKSNWLSSVLQKHFIQANVEVLHDMLGAARALCGKEAGMVAILGTGSNSCLYDGADIIANRKALGYILGDEGSGAYIGKTFVQQVLNEELEESLIASFYSDNNLDADQIIHNVYKEAFPNRFLASFSLWLKNNQSDLFESIAKEAFRSFFEKHITRYQGYKSYSLNVIGSVGFYNKELLGQVSREYGVELKEVIKSPIEGLIEYHRSLF